MQNFINQTWRERYQTDISEDVLTLLWSTIVSIFTVGGFIGATIGGTLSVQLGRSGQIKCIVKILVSHFVLCIRDFPKSYLFIFRKGTLLTNNIFALVAAMLMGLSYPTGLFELLILGRLFTGINAGK